MSSFAFDSSLENTLKSIYLEWLSSQTLLETYSPLSVSSKNIEASLKLIATTSEFKSSKEILDKLNTEFLKINVCFEETDKAIPQKYPDSGIVYAEADLLVYIYVNKKFFNIIESKDSSLINQLSKDIFKIYSHEITHVEQNQKQRVNQPTLLPPQNSSLSERNRYLSNVREIDAHAREVATSLLLKDFDKKEIEKLLTTHKGSLELSKQNKEFSIYYQTYGICLNIPRKAWDNDTKWRVKIFNRFKKRICDFLMLDINFILKEDYFLRLTSNKEMC